jgi:branched-chain amino acid transport system substrate-binding protein
MACGQPAEEEKMMRRRRGLGWGLVAALLAFGWSAGGRAEEPIKIGFIASLSGSFAAFGEQMSNGMELYMRQHGDSVAGRKIVIIRRDTGGVAPELAKRAAQELLTRDKVDFLTGFDFTPNALAVAPLATEAKVPMVLMNAATQLVTEKSPYAVRFSFTQEQILPPAGEWLAKNLVKRVYVAVSDFSAGYESEANFTKGFLAGGGEIVGSVHIPLINPEYATYVQRIKDTKPDAVFFFAPSGEEPMAFLRQYFALGLKDAGIRLIGGTDIIDDVAIENFGKAVLGLYTIHHYSYAHPSALNRAFIAAYKEAFGPRPRPNFYAVGGYDGMAAIYKVIAALDGRLDPEKEMAAFKTLGFESPRGPIAIDPATRDIIQSTYIRRAEEVDGEIVNREMVEFPHIRVQHGQ